MDESQRTQSTELSTLSTKTAVVETKLEALTAAFKEQSVTIEKHFDRLERLFIDAAREDRKEWKDYGDKQAKDMSERLERERKILDDKYQELVPLKYKLAMVFGALVLLSFIAKPLIDKLLFAAATGKP